MEPVETIYFPALCDIESAARRLHDVVTPTPLMFNALLSERYGASIWLKREDLQLVRSYKLRGAYNKIADLPPEAQANGVVCASAGNHAQGVAYSCQKMNIHGVIFMPVTTSPQKVKQTQMFGGTSVEVRLTGDTFDDAYRAALAFSRQGDRAFIHPFDDEKVIEGQGTVGLEILQDSDAPIDYLILPVGGGGLAAGVGSVFHERSPHTKIIGVEPSGAPSMLRALEEGYNVVLPKIDKFVDGAAVQQVGEKTFAICRTVLERVITVDEGAICTTILDLYNEEAMVVEPAGAMAITALRFLGDELAGQRVVCLVTGSNNDITRMEEIKERSMLYEGLKHYFIIRFPQRAGALRTFVTNVLGPDDDIAYFAYSKKSSREKGPAVVGVELQSPDDFEPLVERLNRYGLAYEYLNDKPDLFQFLV